MRRAALLHELSFVYSLGQYGRQEAGLVTRSLRKSLADEGKDWFSDDQQALIDGWTLHEKFTRDAVQGYVQFRQAIDRVARCHADTLLLWTERTPRFEEAAGWVRQEQEDRLHSELAPLIGALADLREELAHWRLAPATGEAPLLNPFAAALALGLEQAKKWYGKDTPLDLVVTPGLAGGTFLQGLAYCRFCERYGDAPPREAVETLGLSVVQPGHGRRGQYQLQDAQWWVLVHIGGVKLTQVATEANKTYQEIQRSLQNTDRALGLQ